VVRGNTTRLYYSDYKNTVIAKHDIELTTPEKPKVINPSPKTMTKIPIAEEKPILVSPEPVFKKDSKQTSIILETRQEIVDPNDINLDNTGEEKKKPKPSYFDAFVVGKVGNWQSTPKPNNREGPKDSSSPPDDNKIGVTLRDINAHAPSYAISDQIDRRGICSYFCDYLTERTFFSLMLKSSILQPFWLRYNYCLLFISILSVTNAMIYLDYYIENRIPLEQPIRVNEYINQ
jgi:hypothetical protein